MDEAVLGNHVDDAVFLRDLHGDREVVNRFVGEVDIHCFLDKSSVGLARVDLYHMKLALTSSVPNCEGEKFVGSGIALGVEGAERSSVTFDVLGDATVLRVELH